MPELPSGAPPSPVTPIGEIAKWELRIKCRGCRRNVVLPVAEVIHRLGPRLPIHKVVGRLRCSGWTPTGTCGSRPGTVMLAEVSRYGGSVRLVRELNVTPGDVR